MGSDTTSASKCEPTAIKCASVKGIWTGEDILYVWQIYYLVVVFSSTSGNSFINVEFEFGSTSVDIPLETESATTLWSPAAGVNQADNR